MRKFSFLFGVGVGYFVGTRAGRQQLEKVKAAGRTVLDDPRVQPHVQRVEDRIAEAARNQAAAMTDKIADAVKARITGEPGTGGSTTPAGRSGTDRPQR
ncbi:MAG TPA: YtxH domain-containing protein [Actinomycetaceae bacterium]|nr:YtxH domain-containing protein [Actinomycetaceae bacterium]